MSANSDYINLYAQDMVDACYNTGLFPSVMMAQSILESAWGKSELASKYNNFFGIKCLCKNCACYLLGQNVSLPTMEEVNGQMVSQTASFRTYATPYDSFVDRVHFLKIENPRYAKAGVFDAATPQDQADALLAAGYATESDYANSLKDLISKYNLEDLDAMQANTMRFTTNTLIFVGVGAVALSASIFLYFKFIKKK